MVKDEEIINLKKEGHSQREIAKKRGLKVSNNEVVGPPAVEGNIQTIDTVRAITTTTNTDIKQSNESSDKKLSIIPNIIQENSKKVEQEDETFFMPYRTFLLLFYIHKNNDIDIEELKKKHNDKIDDNINDLIDFDLIEINDDIVKITDKGNEHVDYFKKLYPNEYNKDSVKFIEEWEKQQTAFDAFCEELENVEEETESCAHTHNSDESTIGFIEFYVAYNQLRTDADPFLSKMTAIAKLGNAIGKKWVHRITPGSVYHNMYLALIGKSSISRKTTVLDISKDVYPRNHRLPESGSPEAFLEDLSFKPQAILYKDEITDVLKSARNRGNYMAGFLEIWNILHKYNNEIYSRSTKKKLIKIYYPYPTIISSTTPELLKEVVTREMMESGFLARFLLAYGEPNPQKRKNLPPVVDDLQKHFQKVFEIIMDITSKRIISFVLTGKALDRYNEIELEMYKKYPDILPFVARYLEYIISIADIMYISDYIYKGIDLRKLVKLDYLAKLTKFTTQEQYEKLVRTNIVKCAKGCKNANYAKTDKIIFIDVDYINRSYLLIQHIMPFVGDLRNYIGLYKPVAILKEFLEINTPCNHSYAMRYTRLLSRDFELARETLDQRGQDYMFTIKITPKKGGKAKKVYCLKKHINTDKCKKCKILNYCGDVI